MSELADEWKDRLGPSVLPFERTQFTRQVLDGEAVTFVSNIINITKAGSCSFLLTESTLILSNNLPNESGYLWVIDETGLKVILESTPNPSAARGKVCHTNITGGGRAYQGGELWFGTDDNVYINNISGRYGTTILAQRDAVLDYFQSLGLNPVQLKPVV